MSLITVLIAAPLAAIAGLYQAHQMEVGAALQLEAKGHFKYELDYGAVSEQAEGIWTFDGATVRLTTQPSPKLPSFELVRDDPAPVGTLAMILEAPGFGQNYRLDAVATDASGDKVMVSAGADGYVETAGHRITSIEPLIPVYGGAGGSFRLSAERGHRLQLRFHPNDLGTAAFGNEPLTRNDGAILLKRYDTLIRFVRVRH